MLDYFRRLARLLYGLPVIGRIAQWVILLVRLPALQRRQLELTQLQIEQAQRQAELAQRQTELAAQQARLQETAAREHSALQLGIHELNMRLAPLAEHLTQRLAAIETQLARIDAPAQENLVISVPVALRRSAREIEQLRSQLRELQRAVLDGSAREPA